MQADAAKFIITVNNVKWEVVFNPYGNGACGSKAAVFALGALLQEEGRPCDPVTEKGARKAMATFMRLHKDGWLKLLFMSLVVEAGQEFQGDLLAYADYIEGEFAWWGFFEWVVFGLVFKIDVYVLHGVVLRSTHGIKMEQELVDVPVEYMVEFNRAITLGFVNLNDMTKGPECANHYVVIKKQRDDDQAADHERRAQGPDGLAHKRRSADEDKNGALFCSTIRAVSPLADSEDLELVQGAGLRWTELTPDQSELVITQLKARVEGPLKTRACDALGSGTLQVGAGGSQVEVSTALAVRRNGSPCWITLYTMVQIACAPGLTACAAGRDARRAVPRLRHVQVQGALLLCPRFCGRHEQVQGGSRVEQARAGQVASEPPGSPAGSFGGPIGTLKHPAPHRPCAPCAPCARCVLGAPSNTRTEASSEGCKVNAVAGRRRCERAGSTGRLNAIRCGAQLWRGQGADGGLQVLWKVHQDGHAPLNEKPFEFQQSLQGSKVALSSFVFKLRPPPPPRHHTLRSIESA